MLVVTKPGLQKLPGPFAKRNPKYRIHGLRFFVKPYFRRLERQVATGRIISSMETPPCWKVPLNCL